MPNLDELKWGELKSDIEKRSQEFQTDLRTFEQEMLAKVEEAKNNEILSNIAALGIRLARIEEQLKEKDEVKEEGDGDGSGKRTLRT